MRNTEEMNMEKILKVEKMHCRSCEMLLIDVISEISGVKKAAADFTKGTVTIDYENPEALELAKKAIEKEGYRVVG
jgi:copper chaperone CopZ